MTGPCRVNLSVDLRRRRVAYGNRFFDDRHRLPAVSVSIFVRRVGTRLVDVEVFLIDRKNRQTECDALVVADRDAGQRRFAGADDVQSRRDQMRRIAQRRHRVTAMRIVRENWPAGIGALRRDDPVVAADVGAMFDVARLRRRRWRVL